MTTAPNSAAQDRALIEKLTKWLDPNYGPSGYERTLIEQARDALLAHEQQHDRIERDAQVRANYDELLYAVARVWPNQSRHQTALMYIRAAEASGQSGDAAMGAADEGGGR